MARCIPGCKVTANWDIAKWPAKSAARVILVPACKATLISRALQAVEVCACRRCEGLRLCPYTAVVTQEQHQKALRAEKLQGRRLPVRMECLLGRSAGRMNSRAATKQQRLPAPASSRG